MSGRETSAEIDTAAAEWAVRADGAPLDGEVQRALDTWLAGDARRLGAFARARATFLSAHRARALGTDFDPDEYLAAHTVRTRPSSPENETSIADRDATANPVRRRALLLGTSAAIAAGTLGVLGLYWQTTSGTYSTQRGEIRLVPLPDGSTMTLNTASRARVRFSDEARNVELVAGEALFEVAKDPRRPFSAAAGAARVHAVGTSFTVSRLADRPVHVLVQEGIVDIEGSNASGPARSRVAANSRAVVSENGPVTVTPVAALEVTRELSWRVGMLAFEDKPLRDAANELARYSDPRIVFDDPTIGDETVTGRFAANDPVGFAKSVALSLGLHARRDSNTVILSRTD